MAGISLQDEVGISTIFILATKAALEGRGLYPFLLGQRPEANPKASQKPGLKGNTRGTRAIEPATQRILAGLPDRQGSIGKSKRFIVAPP